MSEVNVDNALTSFNWSPEKDGKGDWIRLWRGQRDEGSARMELEAAENKARHALHLKYLDLQNTLQSLWLTEQAGAAEPSPAITPRGTLLIQQPQEQAHWEAKIRDLHVRIIGLPESKQLLVIQYSQAHCPVALVQDNNGQVYLDPTKLDTEQAKRVIAFVDSLCLDESLQNSVVWRTGYISDSPMPRRRQGARPNGTTPTGSFKASRATTAPMFPSPINGSRDLRVQLAKQIEALTREEQLLVASKVQTWCPPASSRGMSYSGEAVTTVDTALLDDVTLQLLADYINELGRTGFNDPDSSYSYMAAQHQYALNLADPRSMELEAVQAKLRMNDELIQESLQREHDKSYLWLQEDDDTTQMRKPHAMWGPTYITLANEPMTKSEYKKDCKDRTELHDLLSTLGGREIFTVAGFCLALQPDVITADGIHPAKLTGPNLQLTLKFVRDLIHNQQQDVKQLEWHGGSANMHSSYTVPSHQAALYTSGTASLGKRPGEWLVTPGTSALISLD